MKSLSLFLIWNFVIFLFDLYDEHFQFLAYETDRKKRMKVKSYILSSLEETILDVSMSGFSPKSKQKLSGLICSLYLKNSKSEHLYKIFSLAKIPIIFTAIFFFVNTKSLSAFHLVHPMFLSK